MIKFNMVLVAIFTFIIQANASAFSKIENTKLAGAILTNEDASVRFYVTKEDTSVCFYKSKEGSCLVGDDEIANYEWIDKKTGEIVVKKYPASYLGIYASEKGSDLAFKCGEKLYPPTLGLAVIVCMPYYLIVKKFAPKRAQKLIDQLINPSLKGQQIETSLISVFDPRDVNWDE